MPRLEPHDLDELARCCLLIPAYQPVALLDGLVADLFAQGFSQIVVVDDGSADETQPIFAACRRRGATVLRHDRNRGKGAALKTGFAHATTTDAAAVVTLDADGQHLPRDVAVIARASLAHPDSIILGGRRFSGDVPWRSRLGNSLTRWLFGRLSGLRLGDTQTGLRAFPFAMIPQLLALAGERYEYETSVLMALARSDRPVIEVPIATVYLDNNSASHFRPLLDSIRIYFVLLRDVMLALSSFALDIVLFNAALIIGGNIVAATYAARAVSGIYNFVGSKYFVFRQIGTRSLVAEVLKYLVLAVVLASLSGQFVDALYPRFIANATLCKVMIDLALYGASFLLRRFVVFRSSSR